MSYTPPSIESLVILSNGDYEPPLFSDMVVLGADSSTCSYNPPIAQFVNFDLDAIGGLYSAPLGDSIGFSYPQSAYAAPQGDEVTYQYASTEYLVPTSPQVNFDLTCGVGTADIVWVIGSSGIGWIESEGYTILDVLVSSNNTFELVASIGTLDIPMAIGGAGTVGPITAYGYGERGVRILPTFARLNQIVSEGGVIVLPAVIGDAHIGEIESVTVSPGVVLVQGSFTTMEFSQGIIVSRGRIIHGFPTAPIFREIYELSNQRTVEIKAYPEDCNYPIYIGDTWIDKEDKNLRIGTIDFALSFDHDARDIDEINVWVQNPNGEMYRDRARIATYVNGQYTDHVLLRPFRDTNILHIPVHCVSDKDNQFFLEIVYRQDTQQVLVHQKEERYWIAFQPHMDNRMPYANIADQSSSVTGNAGNVMFSSVYDEIGQIFEPYEDSEFKGISPNFGRYLFTNSSDEFGRIFLTLEDGDSVETHKSGCQSTPFPFFSYISDDLGSIQIGG